MNHLASARDGQPPRSSKPPRGNEAPRRPPRSENRGWFQAFLRTPKGTLTALFAVILAVAGTATGWPQVLPHVLVAIPGAFGVELMASTRWEQQEPGQEEETTEHSTHV